MAILIAKMQQNGESESPLMLSTNKSTGHRKAQTKREKVASSALVSKYLRARLQRIALILKYYLITCLSQLILISILTTECCIGQILAVLHVVTQ
jgi:hypothetical protein